MKLKTMSKLLFFHSFALVILCSIFLSNNVFAESDDELFAEIDNIQIQKNISNNDPFEKINRKIFNFNLSFWDTILVPFENKWNKIPINIRQAINRSGENYIQQPTNIVYSVLDADLETMTISFWRFTINTIFGLFGIFDVASDLGLPKIKKTFSDILYFYHIPRGPYIMLPFIGPSNIRDTSGLLFGSLLTSYFFMSMFLHQTAYMF